MLTPFEVPYRLSMGLISLKKSEWLEIDDDLKSDLMEKKRLLKTHHDEVCLVETGSELAQAEVLTLISAYLLEYHRDKYAQTKNCIINQETTDLISLRSDTTQAIERAASLVQEDLCLLQYWDGAWRLTAATVCFPTRWKLFEKMNRSIDDIHEPVPGYRDKLAYPVSRFLNSLKVEHPVWRLNWSLVDDPALFQPKGHNVTKINSNLTNENVGDKIWLRIERQTLRRLENTGAILFTIRIHRWPLKAIAARPDIIKKLRAAIETMPEPMQQYKSLQAFGSSLTDFLKEA